MSSLHEARVKAAARAMAEAEHGELADQQDADYLELFLPAALKAADAVVTVEQVADVIEGAYKAWWEYWGDFQAGIGDDPGPLADFQAQTVLALLRGKEG